jgi:hypothetical protein
MKASRFLTPVAAALVAGSFLFAGCDSGGSSEVDEVAISGTLTEDAAYGKRAEVEGAVVSATSIRSDGSPAAHPDTAVVAADGSFTIRLRDVSSHVVLEAVGPSIESRVVVTVEAGEESETAAPINGESTLEADVFVEAQAASMDLTLAQIAAFVDARLVAESATSQVDASALASLILKGQEAEEEYVEDREPDERPLREPVDDKRNSDADAREQLQAELAAAASADAQADALSGFNSAFAQGYVDAGLSASMNAEATQARRSALVKFSADANLSAEARAAVEQRADVYVSIATGAAVRTLFVAAGAANVTLDAIDAAIVTLTTSVASAESRTEVDAAFAAFGASIETHLAAELTVPEATIDAALLATATARTALDVAVEAAVDGEAVAQAHKTFYVAAETAASTALSASADAEVAGEIVALVSAR